jgi:hypothetical protein
MQCAVRQRHSCSNGHLNEPRLWTVQEYDDMIAAGGPSHQRVSSAKNLNSTGKGSWTGLDMPGLPAICVQMYNTC